MYLFAGATGAADAVRVCVDVARHVVVDDGADVRNVEAARRHVRRHQNVRLLLLEAGDDAVALALLRHSSSSCQSKKKRNKQNQLGPCKTWLFVIHQF